MIRVKLTQAIGRWSVASKGHADEHVCLAASTLFNAVCAGLQTLAEVYPDQIAVTFDDKVSERMARDDAKKGKVSDG